jgi:hypothetical protein
MNATSWTAVAAVATAVLALGTFVLAGTTVWAHRREEAERRRTAFRSALVALLDACRIWASHDPTASPAAARHLTDHSLSLDAVEQFLSQVTVPPQVLARLLWHLSRATLEAAATVAEIPRIFPDGSVSSPKSPAQEEAEGQARLHSALTLDHLQVAACLIRADATRCRFTDLAEVFGTVPWLAARPGLHRVELEELSNLPHLGAPPFPDDSAYAACAPAARQEQADERARLEEERLRGAAAPAPGS